MLRKDGEQPGTNLSKRYGTLHCSCLLPVTSPRLTQDSVPLWLSLPRLPAFPSPRLYFNQCLSTRGLPLVKDSIHLYASNNYMLSPCPRLNSPLYLLSLLVQHSIFLCLSPLHTSPHSRFYSLLCLHNNMAPLVRDGVLLLYFSSPQMPSQFSSTDDETV